MLEVLQLSDVHMVATGELYGRDPFQTLAAVLADVDRRRLQPDVVVVSGDLVHDGSRQGYERLADALAALDVPVYCLAGNHDSSTPLEVALPRTGVHVEPLVVIDEWLFVFLDSNANGRVVEPSGHRRDAPNRFLRAVHGGVHPADVDWLADVLATTTAPNVFVWMHHPLLAPPALSGLARSEFRDPLLRAMAGRAVRAVAAGHVHTAWECESSGLRTFACPSTWLAFDFDAMTMAPPGYRWFRLHPSGAIDAAAHHVPDPRWAARPPVPEWTVKAIAGDLDHDRFDGLSQDEVIAGLGSAS